MAGWQYEILTSAFGLLDLSSSALLVMKECLLSKFFPPDMRLKQNKTKTNFTCVGKGKAGGYIRAKSRLLKQKRVENAVLARLVWLSD